ncbi:MAG: DNA primase [Armatimonadetes bacterium]|nr:DNA primase [Armatimonadota bacterium]
MSHKLSPAQINQILQANDIVSVIGYYIVLKPAGKNYKGACPFHLEKTPSFIVSPQKEIWHCFGCNSGGNLIDFIMKIENLTFLEAAKFLARKSGINLKLDYVSSQKDKLKKILEEAALYYHKILFENAGKSAYEYLLKRGLNKELIKEFQLGYAPSGNFLIKHFTSKFPLEDLLKVGLVRKNFNHNFQDYFYQRVIFPIFNSQGEPIGFGGRTLDNSNPKYLNTPDTILFSKGKNFYGLNQAKNFILKQNEAIIVEGYLDFLSAYQFGFKNVIASLGTALTLNQANLISKYCNTVILALDGDKSGMSAIDRGIGIFEELNLQVKALIFPQGKDPDNYLQTKGLEAFKELIKNSINIIDYKILSLSSKYNLKNSEGKVNFIKELLPTLDKVKNLIKKDEYVKKISRLLEINEEILRNIKFNKSKFKSFNSLFSTLDKEKVIDAQEELIKIIFSDPSWIINVKQELNLTDLDLKYQEIFKEIFNSHENITSRDLLEKFKEHKDYPNLIKTILKEESIFITEEAVKSWIVKIKEKKMKDKLSKLEKEIPELLTIGKLSHQDQKFLEYQNLVAYFKRRSYEG